ncbi:hypothetical protein RvY_14199 [Ramazzottius varieornatus]|uniref:PAS domain-containing protein n=1 Tax=Ramazzottius varieornatus TaxID=947166 RepID=A0A1D1VUC9_RAMVA|nr:hypothetical protein RvY_14199 [Ramazzottius varieornatus]
MDFDDISEYVDSSSDPLIWDRSSKRQSKQRRDLINAEMNVLRDLLPFPVATRHRLSQLQLMACLCVYIRKCTTLAQGDKSWLKEPKSILDTVDVGEAFNNSLMLCTQSGKLLYIGEKAQDVFGLKFEDLLSHGDNLYDLVDPRDHAPIQKQLRLPSDPSFHVKTEDGIDSLSQLLSELPANSTGTIDPHQDRLFIARINASKNVRKVNRLADQKAIMVRGRFLPWNRSSLSGLIPQYFESRSVDMVQNEAIFAAVCQSVLTVENRQPLSISANTSFTSFHHTDMRILSTFPSHKAEENLEYPNTELVGKLWYDFVHWEDLAKARKVHRDILLGKEDQSGLFLVRLMTKTGQWRWCHLSMQITAAGIAMAQQISPPTVKPHPAFAQAKDVSGRFKGSGSSMAVGCTTAVDSRCISVVYQFILDDEAKLMRQDHGWLHEPIKLPPSSLLLPEEEQPTVLTQHALTSSSKNPPKICKKPKAQDPSFSARKPSPKPALTSPVKKNSRKRKKTEAKAEVQSRSSTPQPAAKQSLSQWYAEKEGLQSQVPKQLRQMSLDTRQYQCISPSEQEQHVPQAQPTTTSPMSLNNLLSPPSLGLYGPQTPTLLNEQFAGQNYDVLQALYNELLSSTYGASSQGLTL